MTVFRTPDERFASLPYFPFTPHYVQVSDTLNMWTKDREAPCCAFTGNPRGLTYIATLSPFYGQITGFWRQIWWAWTFG